MTAPSQREALERLVAACTTQLGPGRGVRMPEADVVEAARAALATPAGQDVRAKAADVGDAWAKRAASDIVQRIADSEPGELTVDAQDRLAGTAMESLYCLTGDDMERAIYAHLSDAFFDLEIRLAGQDAPDVELIAREIVEAIVDPFAPQDIPEIIAILHKHLGGTR